MLKYKKRFYKWVDFFAVVGIVMLIQGMAVSGAFYFTDIYRFCANRDTQFAGSGSSAVAEAEFYNYRMQVLFGDGTGSTLVSLTTTEHTDQVGKIFHNVYYFSRCLMWVGLFLCVLAFLFLRMKKHYKVIRKGAIFSLIVPPVFLIIALVLLFSETRSVLSCVLLSHYDRLFYDDLAFISILPKGLFLGYTVVYLTLWLVLSIIFLVVYYTKKKHRRPYKF